MTNREKMKETLTAEQYADLLGFMSDVHHCSENFVVWSKKEVIPSDHELLMRIYKEWRNSQRT